MRRLQRHRQLGHELIGAGSDAADHHELPQPQILEVERVEAAVLHQRGADVDLVIDAVGLLLLEVVGIHGLGGLVLEVEAGGDRLGDAGDAVLEHLAALVDDSTLGIECGAVRLDPLLHFGAESLQVVEHRFDVGPQASGDADLGAGRQLAFHLGDGLLDPIEQLVERGQLPGAVSGLDDVAGQAELSQQVALNGERSLDRRAANVGERIERIDVREHDGLQLERRGGRLRLQAVEHGLAEAPLHHRVDRGELLLDLGLNAGVQLVHAALDGHGEERQHLAQLRQVVRVEVPRIGRTQRQRADDAILIVQRRDDLVADATADRVVLGRACAQVVRRGRG